MQKHMIVLLYAAAFMSGSLFGMEADKEKAKCTVEFGYDLMFSKWGAHVKACSVVSEKGFRKGFNIENSESLLLQIKDRFILSFSKDDKEYYISTADREGYLRQLLLIGAFKLKLTGVMQESMFVTESGTASGCCNDFVGSLKSNEVTLSIDDLKRLVIKKKKSFG